MDHFKTNRLTGSNPVLTTNKTNIMKKYHLTILRNGKYETIFGEMTSIENFLAIDFKLGYETHIIYSRELSKEEWENYWNKIKNK